MKHLLRLEMKKNNLKGHIKGVFIAVFCIMVFITISLVDSLTDPEQTKDTYESILRMINLLVTGVFIVYSSVWTSKLIISEYTERTILIMFSYPINRKKLILAKLLMICGFTISSMFLGYICCIGYMVLLDVTFDVMVGPFMVSYLYLILGEVICGLCLGAVISLIPFIIGIRKKSLPVTVVTAIILVCLMQPIIGRNPGLVESIIKIGIIAVITLALVKYTLDNKINELELE